MNVGSIENVVIFCLFEISDQNGGKNRHLYDGCFVCILCVAALVSELEPFHGNLKHIPEYASL